MAKIWSNWANNGQSGPELTKTPPSLVEIGKLLPDAGPHREKRVCLARQSIQRIKLPTKLELNELASELNALNSFPQPPTHLKMNDSVFEFELIAPRRPTPDPGGGGA